MKIAQIAPLSERTPPSLYGGTERVVSYLTEELVALGHDVTLFASGDSVTTAELVACCETGLRLTPGVENPLPYHVMQLEQVRSRADEFDILRFHTDLIHFPLARKPGNRTVTTLHGRLDLPDLLSFFTMFNDVPVVSISGAQRTPLPHAKWVGTVTHGLPKNLLPFRHEPSGGYLAFLGRISPEKASRSRDRDRYASRGPAHDRGEG
jgi:glycosyltransferase involved in cell wall biosynthesis